MNPTAYQAAAARTLPDLRSLHAGLVGILTVLRLVHDDLAPIMAANVAKLQARWPDGFRVQG